MDLTPLKIKASEVDQDTFLAAYRGVYEHSAWIALGAWAKRDAGNLDTVGGLHREMVKTIGEASEAGQMTLICAHPDLAGKLAVNDELTAESKSEQAGAGLDKCTPEEFGEFQTLNKTYKEKFGFPFILAVKGHDRQSILASFRARVNHDRPTEFKTALEQIDKIALFRLMDMTEE